MNSQKDDPINDPRRAFLLRALAAGFLAGGAGWNLPALAQALGKMPGRLPAGRSIFELRGEVTVNGVPATEKTLIKLGDRLQTGKTGLLIAVVGQEAVLLRANSNLEIGTVAKRFFRLTTGALLAVFGPRRDRFDVQTPTATIGIRGTGMYTEVDSEKTYFCNCYGATQLSAVAAPAESENIVSRHHDAPRYVLAAPVKGKHIVAAPLVNHSDLELMTLEALVGRDVPFGLSGDAYQGPRRDY